SEQFSLNPPISAAHRSASPKWLDAGARRRGSRSSSETTVTPVLRNDSRGRIGSSVVSLAKRCCAPNTIRAMGFSPLATVRRQRTRGSLRLRTRRRRHAISSLLLGQQGSGRLGFAFSAILLRPLQTVAGPFAAAHTTRP